MKTIFAFFIFLTNLLCISVQASDLNITSNLIDEGIEPTATPATILNGIPLMKGLQLVTDKNLLSILPDGKDTQSITAVGIVDIDDLYNFYKKVLPPLGWTAVSGHDYAKSTKLLHINTHVKDKLSTVTFEIDAD